MMENGSQFLKSEDEMELPPGFRFHPTDEELITHYLSRKVVDGSFCAIAMGEVDMNKVEPWELPWRAKLGEKEWYFFCVRDKKYPTGLRTNRATAAGYWKATGKDKEIFSGKILVGMKKTLVFYKGRAPKGEKTDWVCHEYRLEGKFPVENPSKNDWVISRVFHKTSGGKKIPIGGLMRVNSEGNELPPLMDSSPAKPEFDSGEPGHVHCFSNTVASASDDKFQDDLIDNPIVFPSSSNPMDSFAVSTPVSWGQFPPVQPGVGLPLPGYVPPLPDPSIIRSFVMNQGFGREMETISVSQDTTENSSVVSNIEMGKKMFDEHEATLETGDLECIWNY